MTSSRKPHEKPHHFDTDSAYVAGACYGYFRVFTADKALTFRSMFPERIEKLRSSLRKAFGISCPEACRPGDESQPWILHVNQRAFSKYLFDFLAISDRENPIVPAELLKHSYTCSGFLDGYFDFAQGRFSKPGPGFEVCRSNQSNILKAVAIGLYFDGIYPALYAEEETPLLRIYNHEDLSNFLKRFPRIAEAAKADPSSPLPLQGSSSLLSSYAEYRAIQDAMTRHFPADKPLNFAKLLQLSGVGLSVEQLDTSAMTKIQRWRKGTKPHVAQRVEQIEAYMEELYADEWDLDTGRSGYSDLGDPTGKDWPPPAH